MGFLDGLRARAATPRQPLAPAKPATPGLTGGGRRSSRSSRGGLDFMSALQAHRQWKIRFSNYVQDGAGDALDPQSVWRDDQSELGQWIHGDAAHKFGHLPSFAQLRDTHALFQQAAGRIVQFHHDGSSAQALQLLRGGEYTRQSLRVMGLLGALYEESKHWSERGVARLNAAKRQLARSSVIL